MKKANAKSWNLINSLTDRNASKKGIIKANSKEEQIQKWYNHFKDLLGKQPNVEGEIEVHQILPPQNINEDDFSIEEYEKAKRSIKEGKQQDQIGYHLKF